MDNRTLHSTNPSTTPLGDERPDGTHQPQQHTSDSAPRSAENVHPYQPAELAHIENHNPGLDGSGAYTVSTPAITSTNAAVPRGSNTTAMSTSDQRHQSTQSDHVVPGASLGHTIGPGIGPGPTYLGTGPADNTAGPHQSDMLNKLDPRVDSNQDGSRTLGRDRGDPGFHTERRPFGP